MTSIEIAETPTIAEISYSLVQDAHPDAATQVIEEMVSDLQVRRAQVPLDTVMWRSPASIDAIPGVSPVWQLPVMAIAVTADTFSIHASTAGLGVGPELSWMFATVLGLAATLFAHLVGATLRTARVGMSRVSWVTVSMALTWIASGGVTLLAAPHGLEHQLMFANIYLAVGVAVMVVSYLTSSPWRSAYATVWRGYRRSARAVARARARLDSIDRELELHDNGLELREKMLENALRARGSLGGELKSYVRLKLGSTNQRP